MSIRRFRMTVSPSMRVLSLHLSHACLPWCLAEVSVFQSVGGQARETEQGRSGRSLPLTSGKFVDVALLLPCRAAQVCLMSFPNLDTYSPWLGIECRRRKSKCDRKFPCGRCKLRKEDHLCVEHQRVQSEGLTYVHRLSHVYHS